MNRLFYRNKIFFITFLSSFINIVLSIVKIVVGYIGNSNALIADGFHSFSDLLSDIIVLWATFYSDKKEDMYYHWGYKKYESLAQFILSFLLIFIAVIIGYNGVNNIILKKISDIKIYTVYVIILTIILKEYIYYITIKLAKKLDNNLLIANAWHHRSDSLTSFAVLFGIIISYKFKNLWYIDSFLSILISGFILNIAIKILLDSLNSLLDKAPPLKFQEDIIKFLKDYKDIQNFHKLRMRYLGNFIYLDFHILVKGDISINKAHKIAGKLKNELFRNFSQIKDIIIHIEPYNN